jgi:hypothetical protein
VAIAGAPSPSAGGDEGKPSIWSLLDRRHALVALVVLTIINVVLLALVTAGQLYRQPYPAAATPAPVEEDVQGDPAETRTSDPADPPGGALRTIPDPSSPRGGGRPAKADLIRLDSRAHSWRLFSDA